MSSTFRSLKYHNARLFFAGLAVSNVGTWLQMTAMALLVYRLTGEATSLGITLALQFLPMLFLGAWAGVVADGRDRRRMTILTQSALAAQALLLGVLDLAGVVNIPVVYALALVLGVDQCLRQPGSAGARDRTRSDGRHPECDLAEHRGDDRLTDLRTRPWRQGSSPPSVPPGASC